MTELNDRLMRYPQRAFWDSLTSSYTTQWNGYTSPRIKGFIRDDISNYFDQASYFQQVRVLVAIHTFEMDKNMRVLRRGIPYPTSTVDNIVRLTELPQNSVVLCIGILFENDYVFNESDKNVFGLTDKGKYFIERFFPK